MADVIQLARELGKAIQVDDVYRQFEVAREKADSNQELQDMIGKFNLKRIALSNALNEQEQDQEKLDALDREIKELYDTVMSHPVMAEVSLTKQAVDRMMNFIDQILSAAVNGENPDLVEESSCTGSCSSCGGCH